MRLLYLILKYTVPYATFIYFRHRKVINGHRRCFGRTIYVSNHASSFMDPIVIGSSIRPILFFMTRSDVFKPFTWPILWLAHMLPIFREHDGQDLKEKNREVLEGSRRVLRSRRNLLFFGEGFTDDVFVRRLKPVKKGAARIGFATLEASNWKYDIYIATIGCNYSDPSMMRSDVLIAMSDKICLNDYKDQYLLHPNKTITDLTKKIETMMREQITHVNDRSLCDFHENIMKITRKGMNARCYDPIISIESRWRYSQKLALWINEHFSPENNHLTRLKEQLECYFSTLKHNNIEEHFLYECCSASASHRKDRLFLWTMWPFAVLGVLHCALLYFLCKRFTEKMFKRRVFWSSVKMITGMISIGLANIPVIFLFHAYLFPSYLLAMFYYLCIGLFGLSAYIWFERWGEWRTKKKMYQQDLTSIWKQRTDLEQEIQRIIDIT